MGEQVTSPKRRGTCPPVYFKLVEEKPPVSLALSRGINHYSAPIKCAHYNISNVSLKFPRESISLSQNFLVNPTTIDKIIDESTIGKDDFVVEIGPGKGTITSVLVKRCKHVIAIEADPKLFLILVNKFKENKNTNIVRENFLIFNLPNTRYKVFSNIPFNITSDIVRKLLNAPTPPIDSYLLMQQEAATKFSGGPLGHETLFSVLHKPWFDFDIVHRFSPTDFEPVPNVQVVLFKIAQRPTPLLSKNEKHLFRDFVSYAFTHSIPNVKSGLKHIFTPKQFARLAADNQFLPLATPTQITFAQWLELFRTFVLLVSQDKKKLVNGSEARLINEQSKLQKIHRTPHPRPI